MHKRIVLATVAVVGLAGCAQKAVYTKPGASTGETAFTREECVHQGEMARLRTLTSKTYATASDARLAAAINARAAFVRCVESRGYKRRTQ
jgi:thiamine biosynthesis lipoprotein ApbE